MSLISEIQATLQHLYKLTKIDIQPNWYITQENLTTPPNNFNHCLQATPNHQGYITWEKGSKTQWFLQNITIPESLYNYSIAGFSLRLELTWWSELAEIYINGNLLRQGDLFDCCCRLLLTPTAIPGETISIAVKLVSPNHDLGALMCSRCIYEKATDPGFIADEITILTNYLQLFDPDKLEIVAKQLATIDWNLLPIHQTQFEQQLKSIGKSFEPLATPIREYQIYLLGHAHLDLAWLWTVEETWRVAQNTFSSVLSLQQKFPNLSFGHTTAVLYQWIEENNPSLFAQIQQAVTKGNWEVLGGMWVEPEVNLVSGESLVRQLLYGQGYFQAKFGQICTVAWLPDSFGFPLQLPQILRQAGINYFVTGKLHWNDTSKFPYGWFEWKSPDGTSILTMMSPPNLAGVMDTNPLSMSNHAFNWHQQTTLTESFWLPGVGDHGGGPTQEMLEVQKRWSQSAFFPQMQFTSALSYLQGLPHRNLPVWDDELYLQLHRGCYTTQGKQKQLNSYLEGLLYEAELFSSLAYLISQQRVYRQAHFPTVNSITLKEFSCQVKKIETAWKQVLFNQFHDILPGTSIPSVFVEAESRWKEAISLGEAIRETALNAIAKFIELPNPPHPKAQPLIIFNSLNWSRTELVTVTTPPGNWGIINLAGVELTTQKSNSKSDDQMLPINQQENREEGIERDRLSSFSGDKNTPENPHQSQQLLFIAEDIPSVGYRLFWLYPQENPAETPADLPYILDNGLLKVEISPITGDITSIYDYELKKEILRPPGSQLQAFRDEGQYWDAWNIDPDYQNHPLNPPQLQAISWLETGPLRYSIQVIKQLNQSQWQQVYQLTHNSKILKIVNRVDWRETHTLIKAAFPLNLQWDRVTYGTACGAISRDISDSTKWEVYGLGWAACDDPSQKIGVTILSDYKYGYDSQSQQIRLSLLRSPTWPDPNADKGIHEFTYAIYPYLGNWQEAKSNHKSRELNLPLEGWRGVGNREFDRNYPNSNDDCYISPNQEKLPEGLTPVGSFLDLGSPNLILMAFKAGVTQSDWILRCYESYGEATSINFSSDLELAIAASVDILENDLTETVNHSILPWRITTLRLH